MKSRKWARRRYYKTIGSNPTSRSQLTWSKWARAWGRSMCEGPCQSCGKRHSGTNPWGLTCRTCHRLKSV